MEIMNSRFYSRLRYLIEQNIHSRLVMQHKDYLTVDEIKELADDAEANFAQDLYEFMMRKEIL